MYIKECFVVKGRTGFRTGRMVSWIVDQGGDETNDPGFDGYVVESNGIGHAAGAS